MNTKKRLLPLIMALVMLITLLPAASIFAEGGNFLEISSFVDKREFSQVGEEITFTHVFKNTSSDIVSLTSISTLGTEYEGSFPDSLGAGESFELVEKYIITENDLGYGHFTNSISVEGGTTTSVEASASIAIHRGPGLSISKVANKATFLTVGEVITYTYTVTHTGLDETIYGSVDGPAPGPFILEDDKLGNLSSESITSLYKDESFTLEADYTVSQADIDSGQITNKVSVKGFYIDYPNDPIQAETELTIALKKQAPDYDEPDYEAEEPSLQLKKTADKTKFTDVGEVIKYSYLITNTGNTLVRGDFYGSTDETFKLTDDKIPAIDMDKTPVELDPDESFRVTAEYLVTQADIDRGEITNIARVSGISGNNSLEARDSLTIKVGEKEVPKEPEEPSIGDKLNMEDHFQYISGYPDNTVRPDGLITREEVAAVFYRLLTSTYRDTIKTQAHNFADVGAGRWSEESIATLTNANIIVGYEDGTFRPGSSITRAELAAIASRFDKLTPFTSNKFSDIENHWANQVINSASKKGWVSGYEDGSFRPNQPMTRAEFVALVNNVLNRGVRKENILPNARQFPDLIEGKWYYETMQEAINSHYYTRDKDTGHEIWTEIYFK